MKLLLAGAADSQMSPLLKQAMEELDLDTASTQDAAESLVYKKLAKRVSGGIVTEPVMALIIRAMLSADKLWNLTADKTDAVLILRSKDMFLMIRKYPLIKDTLKISPYKNEEKLAEELADFQYLKEDQNV
ncbi:MAG TPA: hypothetical protein VN381_13325 [Anaerovoracaceae bacterium]|nr:hypothetical protein [Anaerovoracaceae bacterium]